MSEDITQKYAQNFKNYRERKKCANHHVVKKETNSENCRIYSQRKKLLAQELQSENEVLHTPSTSSSEMTLELQPITTVFEMSRDITQRNKQNCTNYRERKKSTKRDVVKRKTNSEYCRTYRPRKKFLEQELQSDYEVLHTPSISSSEMTLELQSITTGFGNSKNTSL